MQTSQKTVDCERLKNLSGKYHDGVYFSKVASLQPKYCNPTLNFTTNSSKSAWMHLRCISETSHAASLWHLKEDWFANLGDVLKTVRCIKDVSSETSLRSFRPSQKRLWVTSETVIRYFQTETFFGYLLSTCVSLNILPI